MGRPPIEIDEAKVLRHAAEAFATVGLARATMDDIAARAGVTKPMLYRRFGDKDSLFEQTIAAECNDMLGRLLTAYDEAQRLPVGPGTRVAVGAFFDYAEQHPHGFRLLYLSTHEHSPAARQMVDDTVARVTDRVGALIAPILSFSGHPGEGVPRVLASALVGMCVNVASEQATAQVWDREAAVDLVADFMRAGVLGVDEATLETNVTRRQEGLR
jgi:AcrR family transcriptional regulator